MTTICLTFDFTCNFPNFYVSKSKQIPLSILINYNIYGTPLWENWPYIQQDKRLHPIFVGKNDKTKTPRKVESMAYHVVTQTRWTVLATTRATNSANITAKQR